MREEQRDQFFLPGFLFALLIVVFNLYFFGYDFFNRIGLTHSIINNLYGPLVDGGYFNSPFPTKAVAALLLGMTFIVKSGVAEDLTWQKALTVSGIGALLFFVPDRIFAYRIPAGVYIVLTVVGFVVFSRGMKMISGLLTSYSKKTNNPYETFQQNEILIKDDQSLNFDMKYYWNGRWHNGYINVIEQRRHMFVCGGPGSGKSYSIIKEQLIQNIEHGFSMFCYDYKYPELSTLVYNAFQKNKDKYTKLYGMRGSDLEDIFCVVNFADVRTSHRVNPLDPMYIKTIADCTEVAQTILDDLKPNKDKGDPFFDGSARTYIAACIWMLRNYKEGRYCSFPHLVELVSYDYKQVLKMAEKNSNANVMLQSMITADKKNAGGQIAGQISSAQIPLTQMIDSHMYWVMSTNEIPLDLNNPERPRVMCVGNIPNKVNITSTAISLIAARMFKSTNSRKGAPLNINIDECTTFHANGMASTMATCRSNNIGFTIAVQDPQQMFRDWGDKEARAVMGNLMTQFFGQSLGEYDRHISDLFGKEYRLHQSLTSGDSDSVNSSYQLEERVSVRNLAELSQGQFVGFAADNDEHKNPLKQFNCFILPDREKRKAIEGYTDGIPKLDDKKVFFRDAEIRRECEEDVDGTIINYLRDKLKKEEDDKAFKNEFYTAKDAFIIDGLVMDQYEAMTKSQRSALFETIVNEKQESDMECVLNKHMLKIRQEVKQMFIEHGLTPPENHVIASTMPHFGGDRSSDSDYNPHE